MNRLRLFKYAVLLVILTAIFAAIYAAVQQAYRQSANDPQIQIAEDAAAALDRGAAPQWAAANQIDAGSSLAPFMVIYGASGTPEAASGLIGGKMPVPPAGVFASARASGEDRVTWQTPTGLRFAAVVLPYKYGYVLVARSLREVEVRENKLGHQVGIAWLASVLLVLVYGAFAFRYKK